MDGAFGQQEFSVDSAKSAFSEHKLAKEARLAALKSAASGGSAQSRK
jgi:hypothetical protein